MDSKHIGGYLGPSHNVGDVMCSKILTSKATILVCSSVDPLTPDDLASTGAKEKLVEFDTQLKLKLNDRNEELPPEPDDVPMYIPYEDECTEPQLVPEADKMDYEQIHLTYDSPVWDSYDTEYQQIEQTCRDNDDSNSTYHPQYIDAISTKRYPFDKSLVQLSISMTQSAHPKGTVCPEDLSSRWKIGLDLAVPLIALPNLVCMI
jgi:hypothetical protein